MEEIEEFIEEIEEPYSPIPKISRTYTTTIKLVTVIPCLQKIKKYMNQVTHTMSSADISIFLTGNQQILIYQEIQI